MNQRVVWLFTVMVLSAWVIAAGITVAVLVFGDLS